MQLNLTRKYFALLLASVLLFIVFRIPYRHYIYQSHLWDFHIADTAPNFFAVLMFVFYKKWRTVASNNLLISSGAFLGMLLYEYFIQSHIYDATIDNLDVIASLIAAVLSYFICKALDEKNLR